jgi:hypothetical protein
MGAPSGTDSAAFFVVAGPFDSAFFFVAIALGIVLPRAFGREQVIQGRDESSCGPGRLHRAADGVNKETIGARVRHNAQPDKLAASRHACKAPRYFDQLGVGVASRHCGRHQAKHRWARGRRRSPAHLAAPAALRPRFGGTNPGISALKAWNFLSSTVAQ